MDARARKLGLLLRDANLAHALVGVGLDTPAKLKNAKDSEIQAVRGVGKAALEKVRARCPRRA